MKVLLDTHALIWLLEGDERLSGSAMEAIRGAESVAVSLASSWEMAIKLSLGKLRTSYGPGRELSGFLADYGFLELNPSEDALDLLRVLPFHHRDPFDRMLAAQALSSGLKLVSRDPVFDVYGVERIW